MTGIDHLANRNSRAAVAAAERLRNSGMELLEPRCMLSVNVTTWHNDLTRQGLNSNETILTPANVNSSTFGKLFSYAVTGQVYAEPLYVSNLAIPGQGTHNVVFVATQNNDVYAFDAVNNGAGGGQLWHVNLGLAATRRTLLRQSGMDPDLRRHHPASRNHQHSGDRFGDEHDVHRFVHERWWRQLFAPHLGARYHDRCDKAAPKLVAASIQGTSVDNVALRHDYF